MGTRAFSVTGKFVEKLKANKQNSVKEEDIPIAVLRKNSPRNINHNYEKLIKILF